MGASLRFEARKRFAYSSAGSIGAAAINAAVALVTTFALPPANRGEYVVLITLASGLGPVLGLGTGAVIRGIRRDQAHHERRLEAFWTLSLPLGLLAGLATAT